MNNTNPNTNTNTNTNEKTYTKDDIALAAYIGYLVGVVVCSISVYLDKKSK